MPTRPEARAGLVTTAISLALRAFTLDRRSLALCRIATAVVVLGDLASRAASFRIHYTDAGILPRQALFELNLLAFPSIYAASGWEPFLAGLFMVHALVAVALLLGYRTRLFGFLLWYLTISLQQRLHMANNGGDTVLAAVLFWGMFLPWGEALSIDAEARQRSGAPPPEAGIYSTATVILCLQALLMYWISVFGKMEPYWLRGEVLYYAFQNDLYALPAGQWLLPYPGLMKNLTYGTLAWEMVGPVLLLSPWPKPRVLACLLFSVMHLNFGLFLRIGVFAFSPILLAIAFLPALVWEGRPGLALDAWLRRGFARLEVRARPPLEKLVCPSRPVNLGLSLLFCYTLLTTLGEDPRVGKLLPRQLDWVARTTGLYQRWGVFLNMPAILDGWFVVEGRLADGREVDLFQGTDTVSWDRPATPFSYFTSFRWPTPLVVITGDTRIHRWLVRALALDWERRHPGDKVKWGRLNLMREQTQPNYRQATVQRQSLWEGSLAP